MRRRENLPRDNLWQDEQRRKPAPRQEPRIQVMSKCGECGDQDAGRGEAVRATKRNVEISHDPEVV